MSGDLHAPTGQRIPGGCADCDAYQTLAAEAHGVFSLFVHHDETCPTYGRLARERKGR